MVSNASPRSLSWVGRERKKVTAETQGEHTHTYTRTKGGNEVAGRVEFVGSLENSATRYYVRNYERRCRREWRHIDSVRGLVVGGEYIGFHKRTHPAGLFRRVSRKFSKFGCQIPCADVGVVQTRSIVSVDSCRVSPVPCVGETLVRGAGTAG